MLYSLCIAANNEENLAVMTGLILTNYCVRYPHAVPFLRNEMPFFSTKNFKNPFRLEGVAF